MDTLIWFSGEKSGLSICMCVSSALKSHRSQGQRESFKECVKWKKVGKNLEEKKKPTLK